MLVTTSDISLIPPALSHDQDFKRATNKWSMNYWPPCHDNTENYCQKLQRWGKRDFLLLFSFEKGIFSALKARGSIINWLFICPFFKILIIAQGRCEKYKLTLKWRLFSHHFYVSDLSVTSFLNNRISTDEWIIERLDWHTDF